MWMRWALLTAGCAMLIAIGGDLLALATGPAPVDATTPRREAIAFADGPRTIMVAETPPVHAPAQSADPSESDALLNETLISVFDRLLFEAQAENKSVLMARAPALLAQYVHEAWRARALDLLERYVDMQEALRSMRPPTPGDPTQLRQTLQAQDALRRRYFTPEEVDSLFGEQTRQDDFMADKMELLANRTLTSAQRDAALAQSEQTLLSTAQRAVRQEAVAHADAMRQTEALDARNATVYERFAVRSETFGHEVARNLAALDQENQEWNARLDRYAAASEAEQGRLRETLFNETERLRLDGALGMRATVVHKPTGSGG